MAQRACGPFFFLGEVKAERPTNKQQPEAAAEKSLAEHHKEVNTLFSDIHKFQTTGNHCMQRITSNLW